MIVLLRGGLYLFSIRQLCTQRCILMLTVGIYALFFGVRLYCLDQDLPPWGIATYQPIDEGAYAQMALHYVNYGDINPNNGMTEYPIFCAEQLINNLIGNLFVLSGLLLIGDNYWGLRVPYVVISFFVFISIHAVLLKIRNIYGRKNTVELLILLAILAYLSIDFVFSMAGRVVEPSILRGLFIQLLILIMLYIENEKVKWLLLGFASTISVFLVYISNMFVYCTLGLTLVFVGKRNGLRNSLISTIWTIIGIFIALLISEYYYHSVWHVGAIANAWSSVAGFQRLGTYATQGLYDIAKHAVSFCSAHANFYNVPIFFVFLCVLGDIALYCFRKMDEKIAFMLFLFVAYFIQTLFSDDYVVRKYIIIYPVVWYLLYFRFLIREKKDTNDSYNNWKDYNISRIYFISAAICFGTVIFRLFMIHDGTPLDFSTLDKSVILIAPIAVSGFAIWQMNRKPMLCFLPRWIIIACLLSMGINSYFVGKYVFIHPTFSEKEIMECLREFDGQYVLGEYENGFTLYNSIKPVLNSSKKYQEFIEKNPELYYFDYGEDWDGGFRYYLDNEIFSDCFYTVIPYRYFERQFKVAGNKRPLAIYKVISKEDVESYYRNLRTKYLIIRKELEEDFLNLYISDGKINEEMYGKDYIEDYDLPFFEKMILHNGCYSFVDYFDLSLVDIEYRKQYIKRQEKLLAKRESIRLKYPF